MHEQHSIKTSNAEWFARTPLTYYAVEDEKKTSLYEPYDKTKCMFESAYGISVLIAFSNSKGSNTRTGLCLRC